MSQSISVIFDLDGVIFDSERIVIDYWKKTARKYGISGIEETCIRCIGITEPETLKILNERYGFEMPMELYRDETFNAFRKDYVNKSLPVKPGVRPLLSFLKQKKVMLAVASSTPTENVCHELELAGLLDYFDCVIGGDVVGKSKPSPDIFLHVAEQLHTSPDQCFVIEDSYNGVRAASNAKMHPIMVPDLLPPTQEMRMLAEEIHNSLFETANFFKNIIRISF